MNVGSSFNLGIFSRAASAPSEAQMKTQLNQAGGSDFARDRVVRQDQRGRSLRLVTARVSSTRLPAKLKQVGKKNRA